MRLQDGKYKNKYVCKSYEFSNMNRSNDPLLLHRKLYLPLEESKFPVLLPP
jgi:hypothetical protein